MVDAYLAGLTSTGKVYISRRSDEGPWQPFEDAEALCGVRGPFAAVGLSGFTGQTFEGWYNVQLVAVGQDGRWWHSRRGSTDKWTPFGDVEGQIGDCGQFRSASGRGELSFPEGPGPFDVAHYVATTTDGRVWATTRNPNGQWTAAQDQETVFGEAGSIARADAAVTAPTNRSTADHLAVVTDDGRLLHGVKLSSGGAQQVTGFVDVEVMAGEVGSVTDVACSFAAQPAALHLCVTTGAGAILHSLRTEFRLLGVWTFPVWTRLGDVEGQAGERGRFSSVACRQSPTGLLVAGTTDDGRLWSTTRREDGSWTPFTDVGASAGRPGPFTDVALVA